MKIDQNIINAVKAVGHDRIVIHELGMFSCKVTPKTKFGDKGAWLDNASIVYGVKNIVHVGDTYVNGSFALFDLVERVTKEEVKETAEND